MYFIIGSIVLFVLLYMSKITFVFQYNSNFTINKDTYAYVLEYKKQLLKGVTQLLNDLNVRFCISHGNLIEYERGKPILHDDDLDIRICVDDFDKWSKYCMSNNDNNDYKYNLLFDNRINYIDSQKRNGVQVRLIQFQYEHGSKDLEKMDIHCDLVLNNIETDVWIIYDIDYNNLRKVTYLGVNTYAPSKEDTVRILTKEYGSKYMIPNRSYLFNTNDF